MIKSIRAAIALFLYWLSDLFNPINQRQQQEKARASITNNNASRNAGSIKFKDTNTYLEDISRLTAKGGEFIAICNQLKKMSVLKKGAIRLNHTLVNWYKPDGSQPAKTMNVISGYNNGRWYKFKEFSLTGVQIVYVLQEMLEAMAQDGWSSMNDGADQLNQYLEKCLNTTENYLKARVKITGKDARISVNIFLIVNASTNEDKTHPDPQITIEIAAWSPGNANAVKSSHTVYFSRHSPLVEKQQA